jgi:hypothetical protein
MELVQGKGCEMASSCVERGVPISEFLLSPTVTKVIPSPLPELVRLIFHYHSTRAGCRYS